MACCREMFDWSLLCLVDTSARSTVLIFEASGLLGVHSAPVLSELFADNRKHFPR